MKAAKSSARKKASAAASPSEAGDVAAKAKGAEKELSLKRPMKRSRLDANKKIGGAAAGSQPASAAESASGSSSRKAAKKAEQGGPKRQKKSSEKAEGPQQTDPSSSGQASGDAKKKMKKKKTAGSLVPRRRKLVAAAKRRRKTEKPLTRRERQARLKRGVIYIGHLPQGFSEPQLRGFFSQFGEVCRVRLFRSRKTAQSKGYAFVEFALREVAAVAAQAMDKYRLFGRTLVCQLTEPGQVKEHVFKNCHKPFRNINWPARAAARYNKPEGQLPSARGISTIEGRLRRKAKRLKELDIDFELPVLHAATDGPDHLAAWASHERREHRESKKAKKADSAAPAAAAAD